MVYTTNNKHAIHYTPIAIAALIGVRADATCVIQYTHTYTHTHTHTHTRTHTRIHTHAHTHTYTPLDIRVFVMSNIVYIETDCHRSTYWG